MRDTISGGRRLIGCKELARWSTAVRNCNACDLRVLVCEEVLRLMVEKWMEYGSIPQASGNE